MYIDIYVFVYIHIYLYVYICMCIYLYAYIYREKGISDTEAKCNLMICIIICANLHYLHVRCIYRIYLVLWHCIIDISLALYLYWWSIFWWVTFIYGQLRRSSTFRIVLSINLSFFGLFLFVFRYFPGFPILIGLIGFITHF